MNVRTRFAPSPTGQLHLGHAYAAFVAWRLAIAHEGTFLLRHEDIDQTRVKSTCYDEIEQDLRWLGISWHETPLRQRERLQAYQAALDTLKQLEVVYPCFCTRKEIQNELAGMAAAPHASEGPLYPGRCRDLTATERRFRVESGASHAWRLDASKAVSLSNDLTLHDLRHGSISVKPERLGDVVLARKDIGVSYHLAVVVDDAFQGITHVTRGEDLLASTHVHRILQSLLKLPEPVYFHHPLVRDHGGKRLAKSAGSLSIATLRHERLSSSEVMERASEGMPPLPELMPRL